MVVCISSSGREHHCIDGNSAGSTTVYSSSTSLHSTAGPCHRPHHGPGQELRTSDHRQKDLHTVRSRFHVPINCFPMLLIRFFLVLYRGWHSACKKTEWWGAGLVVCLERGADVHVAQLMPLPLTVSCFSKIQIGLTFLVLVLDKGPLNGSLSLSLCRGWAKKVGHRLVILILSNFNR